MKKISLFLAVIIFATACKKDDTCPYSDSGAAAPANERDSITRYLASNSIAATEHPSGVFYTITAPGSGSSPTVCSGISFKYRGTFMASGQEFDATTGNNYASFQLGELIVGWQKVLPVLKSGGSITLYIPPSLGYGPNNVPSTGTPIIPGNSYLKFVIELLDVQ